MEINIGQRWEQQQQATVSSPLSTEFSKVSRVLSVPSKETYTKHFLFLWKFMHRIPHIKLRTSACCKGINNEAIKNAISTIARDIHKVRGCKWNSFFKTNFKGLHVFYKACNLHHFTKSKHFPLNWLIKSFVEEKHGDGTFTHSS